MSLTTRIVERLSSIDQRDWERLDHRDNPFLSHGFLNALEETGCVSADTGWRPHHLAVYREGKLVGFAPSYLKGHSHGEFVFDWTWADAYHRNGLNYYPKLLTAIPWSPVTGPRLLVAQSENDRASIRRHLADAAVRECRELGLSSWHCNFPEADEADIGDYPDMLSRRDAQFHWYNRGYRGFDDFLGDLRSRKRKQIRKERKQVDGHGLSFEWRSGDELSTDELDFVYACYRNTFALYGNHAALNRDFFQAVSESLGSGLQVVLALRDRRKVAMSVFLAGGGRLYGRYWGCLEELPGLHFEAAYYQGIEFCIRNGIGVFESGAQGEHKISRGFVPTTTRSFHWLQHEGFRDAIRRHLEQEAEWKADYRGDLEQHLPFRRDEA